MTEQPTSDASTVRGSIAAAEFHVSIAQSAIVERVAAGASRFSDEQRDAARELEHLRLETSELIGRARSLDDAGLVARATDLTARAQRVAERASELRVLFDDPQDTQDAPMPRLDVALEGLVDAILAVADELTVDAELEPDDLLWAAQRVALALEEIDGLFVELGDRATSWHEAETADASQTPVFGLTPAGERAYLAHLRDAPERLYAAARALRLAARRGHLVELESLRSPAQTRVRVADAWLDVTLLNEANPTYRVRVAGTPARDPIAPGVPDGELVRAIAAATNLQLADGDQRRLARAGAERARRALQAIVAYRNSGHRGDPQHAERVAALPDAASVAIPYSHRPDSSQDLVDVLLDLHAERWPVAMVLRDSLAAVARVLTDETGEQPGIDRLLQHPNEDAAAAEHVRALVHDHVAASLEHEARRLRDPAALRHRLLHAVRSLREQGRPANLANLHALGTQRLMSREAVASAIAELETEGLLELEDPAGPSLVWQLTSSGRELVSGDDPPAS